MQDPSISSGSQCGINATMVVVSFTATGQRSALLLQIAQALSVLAIDDTRAPGSPATYGRKVARDSLVSI
jgi:hypothetical protein